MRQLIIAKEKAYASGVDYFDLTQLAEGVLGIFNTETGDLISSKATLPATFAIACGRGSDKMPYNFPEITLRTLSITKSVPKAGNVYECKFTIPNTIVKGKDYTVIITKKGVSFNERNNWTATVPGDSTTGAVVANKLTKQINANTINSGMKASVSGRVITLTGVDNKQDYGVTFADELIGLEKDSETIAKAPILDKAYVEDLASRCAAGKGFNDVYPDGVTIYPGYPEKIEDVNYVLYTLRFANPRAASKQVDEVVYQNLYIAVPANASCIATIDNIFDISIDASGGGTKTILQLDCGHTDIDGDGVIDHVSGTNS